jgi:hypothetical protein
MRWLEHDSPYGIGMDGQRAAMALALAACMVVAGASTFLLLQDSEVRISNDSESMVDPLLQDEGHDHRNASQHIPLHGKHPTGFIQCSDWAGQC